MAKKTNTRQNVEKEHYGTVFVLSTAASLLAVFALFFLGTNGGNEPLSVTLLPGLLWRPVTADVFGKYGLIYMTGAFALSSTAALIIFFITRLFPAGLRGAVRFLTFVGFVSLPLLELKLTSGIGPLAALSPAGAVLICLMVGMLIFLTMGFSIADKQREKAKTRRSAEATAKGTAKIVAKQTVTATANAGAARKQEAKKVDQATSAAPDPISDALNAAALLGKSLRADGTVPDAVIKYIRQNGTGFLFPLLGKDAILGLVKNREDCQADAERRLIRFGKSLAVTVTESEAECSDCRGAGGGKASVRVPYTDNDWTEEFTECSTCGGTGKEHTRTRTCSLKDIVEAEGGTNGGPRAETDKISDAANAKMFAEWIASHSGRMNAMLPDGGTFLHLATRAANPDLIRLLLSAGASVNAAEPEKKYSALHIALESLRGTRGQAEIVRQLVKAGSDLEVSLSGAMYSPIGLVRTLGLDDELRELVLPAKDRAERDEALRKEEDKRKLENSELEKAVRNIPHIDTLDAEEAKRTVRTMGKALYKTEQVDVGYGLEHYSVLNEDLFTEALKRIGFNRDPKGFIQSAKYRVSYQYLSGYQTTYIYTFDIETRESGGNEAK